jgi:hypothetical protein
VIARARHQLKFRVEPDFAMQVKAYCAGKNITETALCQAALEQYLAGTGVQDVQLRRLDRIALELSRLGAGLELLGETLGTFVRLWLAHNPEIDDINKPAAQRDVARRFRRFMAIVVRTIREGRGTLLHQLVDLRSPLAVGDELERVRRDVASESVSSDASDESRAAVQGEHAL